MKKYYTTSDDKMGKILILISQREYDEDKRQRNPRQDFLFWVILGEGPVFHYSVKGLIGEFIAVLILLRENK